MRAIKIEISSELIENLLKLDSLPKTEIIKGLPKDANLIYFDYDQDRRILIFIFETSEGEEIKEGRVLTDIDATPLRFRSV